MSESNNRDPNAIYGLIDREGQFKIIYRVDTSKHDSKYQARVDDNGGLYRVAAVGPVPGLPITVYGDDLIKRMEP